MKVIANRNHLSTKERIPIGTKLNAIRASFIRPLCVIGVEFRLLVIERCAELYDDYHPKRTIIR